ncbi:hypothetical protein SpCBS45565_g02342 [Spizellomyces sp. 'palustris']|nr:hypothetical protein SpCBS45565_g02342 [Spizellomyces sp. 'palustris']
MLTQGVIVKEEPRAKRNKNLLFSDYRGDPLKFYVTRGLHRERIRKLIEEYGGQVVDVSGSDCFMKLGEPGLRTATVDLYSSEYVVDCVQTGQILDSSPYALSLNGLAPGKRTSREAFTLKDKLQLRNHIERHIKAGQRISGNEIYKELASLFPHHTWQSWRDHAVKHILPTLPAAKRIDKRAEQIRNSGRNPVDADTSTVTSQGAGGWSDQFTKYEREVLEELLRISREKDRELVYSALAEKFTAHSQASWKHYAEEEIIPNMEDEDALLDTDAPPPIRLKGARHEFTERDKALIRKTTRNRLGDAGIKGANFWLDFGVKHPQHGAQSWRGHAIKVIIPVLRVAEDVLQSVRSKNTVEDLNENGNARILPGAPHSPSSKQREEAEVRDVEYWSQETTPPDDDTEDDTGMWMTQPQSAPAVDEEEEEGEKQAEEREEEEEEEGDEQAEEREAEVEEDTPWQTQAPISDTQDHEGEQSSEENLAIATQASPLGRNTSDRSEKATSQSPRRPMLRNSPSKTQSQSQVTSPHPTPRKQLLSSPQDPNTQPASQTRSSISRNRSREVESPDLMERDEAPPTVEMVGSTEEELDSLLEEQARLAQTHAHVEEMAPAAKGVAADDEGGTEEAPMEVDNSDTQYLTAPEGTTDENPFLMSPSSSRVIKKKAVPLPEPAHESPSPNIPRVVLTPAPHQEVAESVKTQYFTLFDKLCEDYSSEDFTRHQCLGAVHMSGGVIGKARKLLDAGLDVAKLSSKVRRHIFTLDEDATLLGSDEQAIESLKKVKGREVISHRMRFLHQWSALHVGSSQ